MSGVNTTNNPVMNAEFDVVVRFRPSFWNQYPANPTTPNASTASRKSLRRYDARAVDGPRQPLRIANGSSTTAPIENRSRMKPTGVTSSSAFCTSLNVAPYAIVAAINASSGTSGRAVSHVSGTDPLTSSGAPLNRASGW